MLYQREERVAGKTKYSTGKMLKYAWTAATSFSPLPLNLTFFAGAVAGVFGIEEAIRAILAHLLGWYAVPGWTSLMVVVTLLGSALLLCLGILGQYVGRIYEQSKDRPLYMVSRTFNITARDDGQKLRTVLREEHNADTAR